jgi:SAM-dependent methyltransferase
MENSMITNHDISVLLSAERWTWAKTMPGVPHEYIVRGRCRMSDDQFEAVVRLQRSTGTPEVWGRYHFPYLFVDGYKYWTMGDPVPDTVILNRQKVFSEFDTLDEEVLFRRAVCEGLTPRLAAWYQGENVWDVGCGDGRLLDLLALPAGRYRGCDPSQKAVDRFKSVHPEYASRVTVRAFEECYHSWAHTDDAVLALYGSPNYLMLPYLKMLAASSRPLFLMFYHEGYIPIGLESLHAFAYSEGELKEMFADCEVQELGDYVIVCRCL